MLPRSSTRTLRQPGCRAASTVTSRFRPGFDPTPGTAASRAARPYRARVKARPASTPPAARERCEWCSDPIPPGRRPEAVYCGKRCRQASSRFALGVKRGLAGTGRQEDAVGPGDVLPTTAAPQPAAEATRRDSSPGTPAAEPEPLAAGGLRLAYADPPYPGRAVKYPEQQEVDHRELIERLVSEFPDGWALSTRPGALRDVLALCPPDVRVCSWHRHVRHTPSRRPLTAWEPLIVHGGREQIYRKA